MKRLIGQVMHWSPSQWGAATSVSGQSRADAMHVLAQRIADLAAASEGQPRRDVPRLSNDMALPDQLWVLTSDLLRTDPDRATVASAMGAVSDARAALWG
ncbi:MAG: hypothetical protein ACRDT8_01080 [Micromonosporaceae bacterium]